jgi:hypothetical protein
MDINLDFQVKSPNGEDFKGDDSHIGKILANSIFQANKGNSIKLYDWAMKLWNKEKLVVDSTDFDMLRAFIDSAESLNILVKGQLLKSLDSQKS